MKGIILAGGSGENLFLITKNNLLVCINLNTNKITYSIDINQNIADFLDKRSEDTKLK